MMRKNYMKYMKILLSGVYFLGGNNNAFSMEDMEGEVSIRIQAIENNFNENENIPAKQTLDTLVNYMWSAISGTSSSIRPQGSNEKATSVYLCYPGIPLDPSTLDGMVGPQNPRGNFVPLEYFSSKMVDTIPDITQYVFSPTTNKPSTAYGFVLSGANATAKKFSPKEREAYETAHKILYVEKPSLFRDKPPSEAKSMAYQEYEQKRSAYQAAVFNYNTVKFSFDLSKPDEQRKWIIQSGPLQNAIDNAWSEWVSCNKDDIEQAIAIMGSTLRNGLGNEINRCSKNFDLCQLPSMIGSVPWRAVWTVPDQWWKSDATNWTHLEVKSDKSYSQIEKHTQSYGAEGGFSWGLFSIGGSFGYSKQHEEEKETSSNLSISMDFCTVLLERDWLITDWMKSDGWYLEKNTAGTISSGTIAGNTNDNIMPVIPTAMIIGKNITLTANWSNATRDYLKTSIETRTKVGYGPFSVSGHYEQGDESTTQTSEFEGNTLKVGGMQIIGFIGAAPPKSAPYSDPERQGLQWAQEFSDQFEGKTVSLRCYASYKNNSRQYLDGGTVDGAVFLSPHTHGWYTGTHWKVERIGDKYAFKCLGHNFNENHQYLNAGIGNGYARLVPHAKGDDTGTHWEVERIGNKYAFKCLGHNFNGNPQYLYGNTSSGQVILAPMASIDIHEALWNVSVSQ